MALIHGKQLRPNTLKEELLLVTGATPTNGQILAYDSGSGGFSWVNNTGGVTSISGGTALDESSTTGNVVLNVRTDDSSIYVDSNNDITLGDPNNGNLITGSYGISNDLIIYGNLIVNGTATTVNSEEVTIADNFVLLNSNFTAGTPTQNAGIEILRGDEPNVFIRWDETNDWWEVGNPDGTGSTYNAILTTASVESGPEGSPDGTISVDVGAGSNADKLYIYVNEENLSNIPNSALTNSDITVNVAGGLGGGGTVSLGGSITISGTTDSFVTGGTATYTGPEHNNNSITLELNNGQSSVTINNIEDTFVTGGTVSNGIVNLELNDATNFNLSGDVIQSVTADSPITASTINGAVTIGLDYNSLQLAVPIVSDKELTVTGATSGNNSNTGISISDEPANDGYVGVSVNGVWYIVGDGVTTKDCYFSSNGTAGGVRSIKDITSGDILVWNGTNVGFELDANDVVALHYNILQ